MGGGGSQRALARFSRRASSLIGNCVFAAALIASACLPPAEFFVFMCDDRVNAVFQAQLRPDAATPLAF